MYSSILNSLPLFLICHSSIFFCKSSLNLINSLFFGASSSRVFSRPDQKFSGDKFEFFNNSSFTKFDSFSDTFKLLILMYFSCVALKFVPHLYFCLRVLLLRRKSISFQSVMLQSVLLPESFRGGCSFGAINSLSR